MCSVLPCRMWIWIGIAYNIGISLVLTYLVGLSLTYLHPPKARPTTPADEVAMRNKLHQEAVMRSRTQRRLKVASRQASRQTSGRTSMASRPGSGRNSMSRQVSRTLSLRAPSRLSSSELPPSSACKSSHQTGSAVLPCGNCGVGCLTGKNPASSAQIRSALSGKCMLDHIFQ